MSTADLLRRAADRLDQVQRGDTYVRVRDGKPHRPDIIEADVIRDVTETGETVGVEVIKAIEVRVDDVPFGPQVAGPLAAWLRAAAEAADKYRTGGVHGRIMRSEGQPATYRHTAEFIDGAAALARVILGEES